MPASRLLRSFPPLARAAARLQPAPGLGPLAATDADRSRLQQPAGSPRLPLYHRQGSVALLDDDPDFLDMLAGTVPRSWRVRKFLSSDSCINHLQQQPPHWEADYWAQQDLVDAWRTGASLVPLVLRYWTTSQARRDLTQVLVADYLMPGRDGIETLRELVDWPGRRVLLTGCFDEKLGTDSFNAGLIDQYLVKQERDLLGELVRSVERLRARPNMRHHQIWAATLGPRQRAQLERRSVADALSAFLTRNFVEWVVLGAPFGVLGLQENGDIQWVQLVLQEDLEELAAISVASGMSREVGAQIAAGRKLSNIALRLAFRTKDAQALPAQQVGDAPGLLAAVTRVHTAPLARSASPQHPRLVAARPESTSLS